MILLLAALAQSGPAHDAQAQFREWQIRILEDRARTTTELRRILARKVRVPPPAPGEKPSLTPVRLDFGSMDPMGLMPFAPAVDTRIGEPVVRVKSEAQAAVFNLWSAGVKNLHYVSTDDGRAAFGTSDVLSGPDVRVGDSVKGFGKALFGLASSGTRASEGPKAGIEASHWMGGLELALDGEVVEVAGKVGPQVKVFGGALEVSAQVAVEASAPVVVDDLQWRSRWGAAQVASGAVEKIAMYLGDRQTCAYCSGHRTVPCRKCADRKQIACPGCARNGRVRCGDCNGHGYLTCPTMKSCGSCRGSGQGRCGSCVGGGSLTEYDTVTTTETRTRREMVHVGFDANERPIYEMRTYTEEVPVTRTVSRSVTCGACGGGGRGGTCGVCGGGGQVVCLSCNGTGKAGCGECDRQGTLLCRICRGALDIDCPTCGTRGFACPLCRGAGTLGR